MPIRKICVPDPARAFKILTILQILDGKQPLYPRHRADATFKKAPRSRPAAAENLTLPLTPAE